MSIYGATAKVLGLLPLKQHQTGPSKMPSKLTKWRARNKQIQFLRSTVAIWSYVYYVHGRVIISDARWQGMADELHALHIKHPNYSDDYDRYWKGWDPSTGYTLINIPGLAHAASKIIGMYK